MLMKNKTKTNNVTAQREAVQTLIRQARSTEAALIAAEGSLDNLDAATAEFAAR